MTEATYEKLYREQSRRLEFIEQSLREKRKNGIFNWSSATGRKVKYFRKDIENYINNNSTLKK